MEVRAQASKKVNTRTFVTCMGQGFDLTVEVFPWIALPLEKASCNTSLTVFLWDVKMQTLSFELMIHGRGIVEQTFHFMGQSHNNSFVFSANSKLRHRILYFSSRGPVSDVEFRIVLPPLG